MSIRTRRVTLTALLAAGLIAGGGLAAAYAQHPADADLGEAAVEFEYVADLGQLVYWIPGDDLADPEGNPLDCRDAIAAALESVASGNTSDEAAAGTDNSSLLDLPEGCMPIDVTGPNGQINHGTVVAAFVHSVKDLDYEGPRGQLVSQLAHERFVDHPVQTTDTYDAGSDEIESASVPPANGRNKQKKPKTHHSHGNGGS
jgi:hypothetical protein